MVNDARRFLPMLAVALAALLVPAGSVAAACQSPQRPEVEVAFSPRQGAEELVVKAISSACSSIRLAAYSFTSPVVVRALVAARKRGVDVAVVVDEKNNLAEASSKAPAQALNLLVASGIPTRTVSAFAIHHDKYIVVDGLHVETGSFNFTTSAAARNSENVLVLWNHPDVARQYIAHWQSRWELGRAYRLPY